MYTEQGAEVIANAASPNEAVTQYERVEAAESSAPFRAVRTLFTEAKRAHEEGNEGKARGLYQQCLTLAYAQEEMAMAGWCLLHLANLANQIGSDNAETPMDRMHTLAEEARTLFIAAGETRGQAACLLLLSIRSLMRRDMTEVERLIGESEALSEASGDLAGMAAALTRRGAGLLCHVEQIRENEEQGLALYARAIALYREAGDKRGTANVLILKSSRLRFRNEAAQAIACCEEALALYREIGDKKRLVVTLMLHTDPFPEAQRETYYHEAVCLSRELEITWSEASALDGLRSLAQKRGEMETAREYYTQALCVRRSEYSHDFDIASLCPLVRLALALDEEENVVRLYGAISALHPRGNGVIPALQTSLDQLYVALGDARVQALWAEGAQLTVEETVELALNATRKHVQILQL